MQETGNFWPTFGTILVALFIFGFFYAVAIRWLNNKKVKGQTAYAVVFGVAVTVIAMGPVIGWQDVFLILAGFAASGFWMVLEDVQRAYLEDTADRKKVEEDRKKAEQAAKDLLNNEQPTGHRKKHL